MAIRFRYDPELKILFTTAEGLVTFLDIEAHLEEEKRAGALAYRELFDATQAWTNVTADQVRILAWRLVGMMRTQAIGPTAVITVDNVLFGMASMLAILSELEKGPPIAVFRTFAEGLEWLLRVGAESPARDV